MDSSESTTRECQTAMDKYLLEKFHLDVSKNTEQRQHRGEVRGDEDDGQT